MVTVDGPVVLDLGLVVGLVLGASLTWALAPKPEAPTPPDPRQAALPVPIPAEPAEIDSATLALEHDRAVAARLIAIGESISSENPQAVEPLLVEAVRLDPTPLATDALARIREAIAAATRATPPLNAEGDALANLTQRAATEATQADSALAKGRERFLAADDALAIRRVYLAGLGAAQRAVALAPESQAHRGKLEEIALELSAILRLQGRWDMAEAILAANGIDSSRVPLHAPLDPYLVVEEGNLVTLQRSFPGGLRILPTTAFAQLRRRISGLGDRYRIWVRVISKVRSGTPTRVTTSAIWVRCENKKAATRSQWVKVKISRGRPYERIVEPGGTGSALLPFDRVKGETRPEFIRQIVRDVDSVAQKLFHKSR